MKGTKEIVSEIVTNKIQNHKPTVLVVDGDETFLEAFRMLLKSENCEMIEASDTDDALRQSEGRRVDLLITEFMLKMKSSVELFTLIRKSNPKIPIVVMTKHTELITDKDIKMFGGNNLLPKPLELSKLRGLIRGYCNPLQILN